MIEEVEEPAIEASLKKKNAAATFFFFSFNFWVFLNYLISLKNM